MTKITDTKIFGKIFGDVIVANSSLDKNHVINAKSLYGGTLQKGNDNDTVLKSFKPEETFATFLVTHDNSSDTMTEDVDNTLTTYESFICSIMIYGEHYNDVTSNLYARLLTQEILTSLHSKGVHIQTIENKGDASDFLNGMLVKRRDLIIHFSCEMDTSKIEKYDEMSSFDIETITPSR